MLRLLPVAAIARRVLCLGRRPGRHARAGRSRRLRLRAVHDGRRARRLVRRGHRARPRRHARDAADRQPRLEPDGALVQLGLRRLGRADGGHFGFDEWSWLNHVQLTTPGEGPVDLGLLCELERPRDRDEGTGIVCGPTLQADTDRLQVNFNPLIAKHVDAAEPAPAELEYQWQVKGLLSPGIELGAQGFGDVGPWNHWRPASQQEHTLGPVVVAKWMLADGRPLQLDAGVLFGVGAGSPRDVLRLRVQHEF